MTRLFFVSLFSTINFFISFFVFLIGAFYALSKGDERVVMTAAAMVILVVNGYGAYWLQLRRLAMMRCITGMLEEHGGMSYYTLKNKALQAWWLDKENRERDFGDLFEDCLEALVETNQICPTEGTGAATRPHYMLLIQDEDLRCVT